jgi:hypothetical protein
VTEKAWDTAAGSHLVELKIRMAGLVIMKVVAVLR